MEPEICTKMPRNLTEKLGALGYFMIRTAYLNNTFSGIFQLESAVEGQQLQQKDKKRRKSNGEKI